ncbi:MAG: hypothetical protein C0508_17260 [Cyanobacteria bacterium PR.023]|nr:hypothetical protein [Cyanobacteria bacterium PR.023]
MTDKPSMSERPAPNYSMGEQLAMRVEQRIQTNPNTSLPDFIRNELADYRNGGNASGYSEMVATMTNKLQKDGYLPVLALQAAREDFDDISQDQKKISKKDLAAQNKMTPAQDAFERFLDGAGRDYLSTRYEELRKAHNGGFLTIGGDGEISKKDIEKALGKARHHFEENPRFINASNFAPPKDIEPKKAEVKIEGVVAPIKPADKNDLAVILRLPTSPYRIKSGDTFNEIIASHYSHLFKFERPAAAQVVMRLNPEVKDANVIQAGAKLALPTEGAMTAHIRNRRRVHKTH